MSPASPPVLPETAPFTPEQRGWLNGYLAATWPYLAGGMVTATPTAGAVANPAKQGVPVTILWGSQTGNAEGVARRLAKVLSAEGHTPTVYDMAAFDHAALASTPQLLVVTSTYGDGEPPDNAADLHRFLHSDAAPALDGMRYSVFALGDSEYPDFCKCGADFDARLTALGATCVAERVDADVEFDAPFSAWAQSVLATLAAPA